MLASAAPRALGVFTGVHFECCGRERKESLVGCCEELWAESTTRANIDLTCLWDLNVRRRRGIWKEGCVRRTAHLDFCEVNTAARGHASSRRMHSRRGHARSKQLPDWAGKHRPKGRRSALAAFFRITCRSMIQPRFANFRSALSAFPS